MGRYMLKSGRDYLILFLLAGLFLIPGPVAYWCYLHPEVFGTQLTNKGELLRPAFQIPLFERMDKKLWRIVLIQPKHCDSSCIDDLQRLAKVRLAFGRRAYQLQVILATQESVEAQALLDDVGIAVLQPIPVELQTLKVTLVNPEGFAVLSYDNAARADALFHDLKKLLR